jgi:hypothetical protein
MSKYTYHIRGHGMICIATTNKTEKIYATKIPSNIEIFTYTSIGRTMIEDECRTGSYDYVCNYMKPHLIENTLIKLQTPIYKYRYKNIGEENSNSYLFPEVVLFTEPEASQFTYGIDIIHCNPTNNEQVVIKKITGQYSLSKAIIEIKNDCKKRYIDYPESTIQINLGSCLASLNIDPKKINLPTDILVSIDTFEKYLYEDTSNIYSYFYKNITFIITSNTNRSSDTDKWQLYYDYLMNVNRMFIDTYGELTTILNPISCPIDLTTTADNKKPIIEKIQNEFMNFVRNNNLVSKYKPNLNLNTNIEIELTHDILIENESLKDLNTSISNAYHMNANHMNKKVSIALKASELNKSTKELTNIIDGLIKSKIDTQDSKPKPQITLKGRDKTFQEVKDEAKAQKLARQAKKAKEAEEAKAIEDEQAKAREAEEAKAEEAKAIEDEAREAEQAKAKEAEEAKAIEAEEAREAEEAKAREAEEAKKKGQQPRTNKRRSIFSILRYKPKYATLEVRLGGKKLSHKSKKFRKRHKRISIKRRLRTPKRILKRIPRRII